MKTTKMLTILVLAMGLMAWLAKVSEAAPLGTAFMYQGLLIDGTEVLDGSYDLMVSLFDDPNEGELRGTVFVDDLDVNDGWFEIMLDFGDGVFDGSARWLETAVRPGELNDPNEYVILLPRREVTPTPYALYAKTAGTAHALDAADGAPTHAVYVHTNGNVGIGTTSPSEKLDVEGNIHASGLLTSGSSIAIDGTNDRITATSGTIDFDNENLVTTGNVGIGTTHPTAKLEVVSFNNHAVYGKHEDSGNYGVLGGPDDGIYGYSGSIEGTGVYGEATGTDGVGIEGYATGFEGVGVEGEAEGEKGVGVEGAARGAGGVGVYGEASATDWVPNYGGYFKANGDYGIGVYGYAVHKVHGSPARSIGVQGRGAAYDFYAAGPGTNYGAASSIRWKSDIRCIDEPLEKVLRLRGVYFNWDAEHGGHHDVGMIAEEVGEVLPEVVQYEEDGKYTSGMDYSKLTPLLVEAVKELKRENDRLRQRLEALEKTAQQNQSIWMQ